MNTVFNETVRVTGIASCFPSSTKNFKQLQVQMYLDIPAQKPDMEHILHDNIEVEITETHVIETPCSVSYEGQIITGRKLIIEGIIKQKVEYVAANCTQSVHAAEFATDFSTYIILGQDNCTSYTYQVTSYVEDVFIKQLDCRTLFKNVMLLLVAVPDNAELQITPIHPGDFFNENDIDYEHPNHCRCLPSERKYFSQICCEETIRIPHQKPDIEQIISIIVEPEIISLKFINTMKGISNEGQRLSGKKAVMEIKLKQKTLYAADLPDQSVYGTESICYKSAYIVLPALIEGTSPDILYKCGMLKPKITIEDVYYTNLDKRRIFKNICMMIELELIPTYEICYSSYHNCTKSNLFLCYEDGSSAVPVTQSKNCKNIKPSWSPNGSQIAYLSGMHDGYTLYNFTLKPCSHKALIPHGCFDNISSYSWLKDSQRIIFSGNRDKGKDLYIIETANGRYRQITQGDGLIKSYYPKVSPKGSQIAYLRSTNCLVNLWYSDIEGKNPCNATCSGAVRDYDWLADDEGIVYIDSKNEACCEINIIKLGDHHASCIVKSDSLFGCKCLAVSPDGRFIAYVGTNKIGDDIYVYNRETEKIYNVTKHQRPTKISGIEWKVDSCKIYYAAREQIYYDMCSVDMATKYKDRLTNTTSSYMQLSYRPRIK